MKRLLCLLLALGCLFALSGCRSREERQEMRRQLDYASGKTTFTPEGDALADGATIDQQVFFDDHQVVCTLLAIYEDSDYYYLPYSVRNDSRKDASVTMDSVLLNGWSFDVSNSWLSVISAGMDYGVYKLYKDSLPSNLLGPISTITCEGTVYGDDGDFYENFSISFSTSNPPASTQSLPGQIIYQDSLITITFVDLVETSWQYEFYFAVENTSSSPLYLDSYFYDEELPCAQTINGVDIGDMIYFYSSYLSPGALDLLTLELYYDDLESLTGVQRAEDITSLTFPCRVDPEDLRSYGIALEVDLTQADEG